MYTKQEIILKSYRDGQSQREIARSLQINRKTVQRYIAEYESHLKKTPSKEGFITEFLCSAPKYKTRTRKRQSLD